MKSPPRLVDDADMPAAVREHLRRAAAVAPLEFDLDAARSRFETTLARHTPEAARRATDEDGGISRAGICKRLGWIIGATVLGVCAVSFVSRGGDAYRPDTGTSGEPPPQTSSARLAMEDEHRDVKAAAALAASEGVDARLLPDSVPSAATARPRTDARASATTKAKATTTTASSASNDAVSSSPTSRLREEADNLAELAALARSEPARAATFADEGHRRFPNGALYAERESIAITSLAAAGRTTEARARAHRFLAQYPNSPAAKRVRNVLDLEP